MPTPGGAIQLANSAGSWCGAISSATFARASAGGRPQPPVGPPRLVLPVEEIPRRADVVPRERADLPVEPFMRKDEPLGETGLLEFPVPAPHPALAVGDVLIAQVEVERGQQ